MYQFPKFKENSHLSVGVELELQLIDLQTFNLAMEAKDFLRRVKEVHHPGAIQPEITLAMIEINSTIHQTHTSLSAELKELRDIIAEQAIRAHIGVCGGGTHPFQKWQDQRIYPTTRFNTVSETYGFLAKQFTVFGQHIHLGCANGDEALYLCHALARYLPQFIALAAASPYHQGVDTNFDCSRLTVISAFPLSGTPPWCLTWEEFEGYFNEMANLEIVKSMKDFYWDIRPKPEFGTVELRICDTPLTTQLAADLAGYAQMLAAWILDTRPDLSKNIYLTYLFNRFNAARYGLEAIFVDPIKRAQIPLFEDILLLCHQIEPYAEKYGATKALENIRNLTYKKQNGSSSLRDFHKTHDSLGDIVRNQIEVWRGD